MFPTGCQLYGIQNSSLKESVRLLILPLLGGIRSWCAGRLQHWSQLGICLTEEKHSKFLRFLHCLEHFSSISVRLFSKMIGLFNFALELSPLFKSYLRVWYNQLRVCKSPCLNFSFGRCMVLLLLLLGIGPGRGFLSPLFW